MLTEIIKSFITKEEIMKESVLVSSEGSICAIGTERGTLGIKEDNGTYKVCYFSIDGNDGRFVSGGDNPALSEWYKNLVESWIECEGFARAAYFEKEFSSFEDAFQLSSYILSRILPPTNGNKIH